MLIQKGYAPLKVQERAIQAAAMSSLGVLGQASVRVLLFHMCALTRLLEKDLLVNYREFEKALWAVLGNGADILLKRFSDELARNVPASGLGLNEILDAIRKDEPFVFVRNMNYGENALLLYRSESFRNRVVSGFFDPIADVNESRAAVFANAPDLPPSVAAMTFEQLQERHASIEKSASEWIFSLKQGGRRLRLAKDNTWLAEKGLDEGLHEGRSATWKDAAVLCAYDAGRIDADKTLEIMELHDVMIFEDSRAIYARV